MVKKSDTVSAKLCSLQRIFCVQDTKYKQKSKVQDLPARGRKVLDIRSPESESSSDELQLPENQTTPRGPKQDPLGRLFGDFRRHKLEKLVGGGEGKRKYPLRQRKVCAAHKKQSETRYICKFYVVPLHKGSCFEKYHSTMSYKTIYMQFLQSGAQERNLECQTISKNMLWG